MGLQTQRTDSELYLFCAIFQLMMTRRITYGAVSSSALLLSALVALQLGHLSYGGDEIHAGIDVGLLVEVENSLWPSLGICAW